MGDTIFTKIISGAIPSHKVYEDELVFAFLDIAPLSKGHTLVIPKEAAASLHELSDESAAAIGKALPTICRAVLKATGAKAYNILQNNGSLAHQAVFHVHFHIIPKFDDNDGLGILWPARQLEQSTGAILAEKIRAAL